MKEVFERIYNNCFCEGTLINLEKFNKWKEAYLNLGKALKETLNK